MVRRVEVRMISELFGRLPLTFSWWVKRELSDGSLVLDAGCGDGAMTCNIARPGQRIVGVEVDFDKIQQAQARGVHMAFVQASLDHLPFRSGVFDEVFSLEVIEHLTKDASRAAISELERVANRMVLVTTPNEKGEEPSAADSDPFMEHKCEWAASELESLGFSVDGLGARWAWGPDGLARRRSPVRQLAIMASALIGILVGHRPLTSAGLLAVRRFDNGAGVSAPRRWFPLFAPNHRRRSDVAEGPGPTSIPS